MKRPFLERSHFRSICIAPRALGEDEDALSLLPHLRGRLIKRRVRRGGIGAIDKDGSRERHEPAQKRNEAQGAFGRNAAVPGEDGPQEEDVEFGLVIPDDHAGSRVEVILSRDNVKMDACRPGHGVLKGSRDGPLADAVLADEAQSEGGDDAVGGTEDEAAVRGEEAGVEGGRGDGEVREGEESACEAEIEGEEAKEEQENCVHGDCLGWESSWRLVDRIVCVVGVVFRKRVPPSRREYLRSSRAWQEVIKSVTSRIVTPCLC